MLSQWRAEICWCPEPTPWFGFMPLANSLILLHSWGTLLDLDACPWTTPWFGCMRGANSFNYKMSSKGVLWDDGPGHPLDACIRCVYPIKTNTGNKQLLTHPSQSAGPGHPSKSIRLAVVIHNPLRIVHNKFHTNLLLNILNFASV